MDVVHGFFRTVFSLRSIVLPRRGDDASGPLVSARSAAFAAAACAVALGVAFAISRPGSEAGAPTADAVGTEGVAGVEARGPVLGHARRLPALGRKPAVRPAPETPSPAPVAPQRGPEPSAEPATVDRPPPVYAPAPAAPAPPAPIQPAPPIQPVADAPPNPPATPAPDTPPVYFDDSG